MWRFGSSPVAQDASTYATIAEPEATVPHSETDTAHQASRRVTSRIKTPDGVWVIWTCAGRDETSRVRDLSLGGLFIETPYPRAIGAEALIDFLFSEGQIRAKAVVRHVEASCGLGLEFTAINDNDRQCMINLLNRPHSSSQ